MAKVMQNFHIYDMGLVSSYVPVVSPGNWKVKGFGGVVHFPIAKTATKLFFKSIFLVYFICL